MRILPRMQAASASAHVSRWPLWAALSYLLFPIYGSLVPLAWTPHDPDAAWAAFAALMAAPLQISSQADFAANVLLMAPFTFLLMGAQAPRSRSAPSRLTLAFGILVLGASIAALLEFAQMFFSGRVPAKSDVLAQALGAGLGLVAWCVVPPSFWAADALPRQRWQRWFALYMAGLVLYSLMPLDLTVSVSDLADKWRAGRVRLLPFSGWSEAPLASLTNFVLDLGLWAVAAWLWRRAVAPRLLGPALLHLVLLAAALELAQLLVLSRTTDSTTVLAALFGVLVAGRGPISVAQEATVGTSTASGASTPVRWLLALLASLALVVVQTWPFELISSGAALRARWASTSLLPFASYAGASELYLVTNALRRVAAYGVLAGLWAWALAGWSRRARVLLGGVAVAGTAALVETLQVVLPAAVVDSGDVLLAAAVAALVLGLRAPGVAPASNRRTPVFPATWRPARAAALAWLVPLVGAVLLLPLMPGLPYNLRELLHGGAGLPVLAGLLLLGGLPRWLAERAAVALPGAAWRLPLGLLAGALTVAALLLAGAPRESVDDLVGSRSDVLGPVLEPLLRLAALLLGPLWALALGHGIGEGGRGSGRSMHLLLHGLWVLPLWHGVVVLAANTDNLTELMANGGGWGASLALLALPAVLGLGAAQLRRPGPIRRFNVAFLVMSLSALLLHLGTESTIVKYGQAFSALQFLLSSDRAHYAHGFWLGGRLALALGFGLALSTLAGWLADAFSCPPTHAGWDTKPKT